MRIMTVVYYYYYYYFSLYFHQENKIEKGGVFVFIFLFFCEDKIEEFYLERIVLLFSFLEIR